MGLVHSGTFSRRLPGKVRNLLNKMPIKSKQEKIAVATPKDSVSFDDRHPYLIAYDALRDMKGCSASELPVYQEFYEALAECINKEII